MLTRENESLNTIKKIFDRIEPIDPTLNVGFRSLKNIGLWLVMYALTDKADQLRVIKELTEKAAIIDSPELKVAIDLLASPENLEKIIKDSEEAGGTFTISVPNDGYKQLILKKGKQVNLTNLLTEHVVVNPNQDSDLNFKMENIIEFIWARNDGLKAEYERIESMPFGEDKQAVPYLSATNHQHAINYNLVTHAGQLYHVASFGALQEDKKGETHGTLAYIIEPAQASGLQTSYLDIIKKFKATPATDPFAIKRNKRDTLGNLKFSEKNIQITLARGVKPPRFELDLNIKFPELAQPISTEETRLGIYEVFLNKSIAFNAIKKIIYLGKRKLNYDNKGGRIENLESASCDFYRSSKSTKRTHNIPHFDIEYTTINPYAMVYEGVNGSDYYCFNVVNPVDKLVHIFDSSTAYQPATTSVSFQQATGEPTSGTFINSRITSFFKLFSCWKGQTSKKDETKDATHLLARNFKAS
jgi:hypothetical protein